MGIYIDENLTWNKHIEHLKNGIVPLIGILYKIRNWISINYLKNIYFSLVYSKIQYLISIWGSAVKNKIEPLNKIQNKIIKCIYKLPLLEPTINLYKPKGLLNISNLYKLKVCTLIHSILIKEKSSNIILTRVNEIHKHDTRQLINLKTLNFKTTFRKKSVLCKDIYSGGQKYGNFLFLKVTFFQ